jgi:small subunit ribosomal protein S15
MMSYITTTRADMIKKYARTATDTGSPEVQVALLTQQIANLTEHLKIHKKDVHSELGLKKQVGQRRRLLDYLKRVNFAGYTKLIADLGLRK